MQTQPVFIIVAFFTAALILVAGVDMGDVTGSYVKDELLEVQMTRVINTATALDSMPAASIELDMAGYEVRYSGDTIGLRYDDETVERSPDILDSGYDNIRGPSDYKEIEDNLVLVKNQDDGQETLTLTTSSDEGSGNDGGGGDSESFTFSIGVDESHTFGDGDQLIFAAANEGSYPVSAIFRSGSTTSASSGACGGQPLDIVSASQFSDSRNCLYSGRLNFQSGEKTVVMCSYDSSSQTAQVVVGGGSASQLRGQCGGVTG